MGEDPNLVFLLETKVRASFISLNKFKLGFHNTFVVDCEGKSGGENEVIFEVLNYSVNHIHGLVSIDLDGVNQV